MTKPSLLAIRKKNRVHNESKKKYLQSKSLEKLKQET